MKKAIFLLLFLLPMLSKSQILIDMKVADTIKDIYNDMSPQSTKSLKLRNNTILILRNFANIRYNNYNQVQYDSLQFSIFNTDGLKLINRTFSLPNGGYIVDAIQSNSGDILLAGEIDTNTVFIKLDSIGNLISMRMYSNPDTSMIIHKLTATNDNHFIVTSSKSIIENADVCYSIYLSSIYKLNQLIFLSKVDIDGNLIWQKQISDNKISSVYGLTFNLNFPEIDILNEADNTFNVIKTSKTNYDDDLQIEYLHMDKNGNILENKIIGQNFNDQSCNVNFDNVAFRIQNNGYLVIWKREIVNEQEKYKNYHFDKSGNLTDSTEYSRNIYDNSNFDITLQIQFKDYFFKHTSLQNNEYLVFSYSSNVSNLFSIDSMYTTNRWKVSFIDSTVQQTRNIFFTSIDDTTLLFINNVDLSNSMNDDSTYYVKFYKISMTANQIYCTTYIDRNNNAIFDSNDTTFNKALIEISDGTQTQTHQIQQNGIFTKFFTPGTYTSKLISYEQNIKYYSVTPTEHTTIFASSKEVDSVFFRLVPKPNIQDLQVSVIPTTGARPGFLSTYKVLAKNVGTKTIENINIKFLKDSLQTIDVTPIFPTSVVDDTLIWNIDSMAIFETKEFTVTCRNAIPPGLNANDTLLLFASITPFENDSAIIDNSFLLKQVVVNSIDPNDKIEAHGGGITAQQLTDGDYLYYTIRFQNTGTGYATKIKITDTLSDRLNWNTLDILANTNNLTYTIENKNIIIWWNDNVYLPDSTSDEINSHGYVSFRIKPITNLLSSDSIENKASIYFDYNIPVITNTATTQIIEQRITNIIQKEVREIKLYPSPTSNMVQLEFNSLLHQNINLSITDMQGKVIYTNSFKGTTGVNSIQLSLSDYPNGVYFILLNTDNSNIFYGKVLKQ